MLVLPKLEQAGVKWNLMLEIEAVCSYLLQRAGQLYFGDFVEVQPEWNALEG